MSKTVDRSLRRRFESAGYRFGMKPARLNKELLRLMGRSRFEEYLDAADAVQQQAASQRRLYEQARSYSEANLLMSFQADIALRTAEVALEVIESSLQPSDSVLELGCWTGVLASHIAGQHADVSVVGVDALPNVIEMASAAHQERNLRFVTWDYAASPPAAVPRSSLLVTLFGIDFADLEMAGHRVSWPQEITTIRESASYRRRLAEARPYFANWRAAALEHARLVAVLRVPSVYRAIPILDAAAEAGWEWQLAQSKRIRLGEERFPLFVFRLASPTHVLVDDVLAWWASDDIPAAIQPLTGAAAWLLFLSLVPKAVIDRHEEEFDGGNRISVELGIAGGLAYRFESATIGDARLTLRGRLQLEELRAAAASAP